MHLCFCEARRGIHTPTINRPCEVHAMLDALKAEGVELDIHTALMHVNRTGVATEAIKRFKGLDYEKPAYL